jgi:L-ascorbate metabolism protein UlaG (beta-lactamase superfamily)
MKLSHLGHSTVLVDVAGVRILIDPGNYSSLWHHLSGLDAIVVTHQHADHVDPQWAPTLLAGNPGAKILVEPGVPDVVDLEGAVRWPQGEVQRIGQARLESVGGRHAVIHRDIPRVGNIGLVVSAPGEPRFFHPGDALDTCPEGVDVAAIPIHAPWCAMKETIDFTRSLGAPQGFFIHEALINESGWALTFGRLNDMTSTVFTDRRGGSPFTV